ncbi:MAG: GspE/PulE family protein, partial [Deltaproteobacteria bacterium]|nr:GspE/PulE family protein [Deltaproteobacteria bacterium]
EKISYYKALNDISNQIHSARNMDEIFLNLNSQMLSLFDTERISIYAIDAKRKELYQRLKAGGTMPREVRLPVNNESIAGYTANNAQVTNILNAYNNHELAMINRSLIFDRSWDKKNSFRTRQVLTVPIFFKNSVIGVLQLINKNSGNRFTLEDQNSAIEMANVLGIAFYNQIKLVQKTRKKTRFDYLINNSLITEKELEQAIIMARDQKISVETVFINDFKVKKNDVGKSLGEFYGCEYVPYDSNYPIPGDLLARLKHVYLKKNLWVPLSSEDGRVRILIDNPQRLDKVDSIKSLIQAETYDFCVGLRDDIVRFLDYFYGTPQVLESDSIHDIMAKLDIDAVEDDDSTGIMTEDDSAIVQLVNKIITDGHKKNASDIHVEPYPGKAGAEIRFRIDGSCEKYQTIPYHYKRAIVSRIKIMSELDISERRKPQDGKIKFKKYAPLDIELRVATIPTVGGEEDVVMRILTAGEPVPLDAMGLSERNYKLFTHLISQPHGIVLVVGPTGSGKTTTLHAALSHINKPDTKIWTAEDPVEITQKGLRQVQVQPKIGLDFSAAMRSFLRADPDVIMVGEMRDHETVSTGIEASLTGHLVFSTLHTNSAPETITRLLDMGMDPFNFADAILGILAQRLVRTLCKFCKEPYHPDKKEFDELQRAYAGDFNALHISYTDDLKLYRQKGCDRCSNTGYKGRTGIIELLDGTDRMRTLIQEKAKMEVIREQAIKDGMTTLMQDGIRKVFLGLTSLQQVRKVCVK